MSDDNNEQKIEYQSFEDTTGKPLKSYTTFDNEGNEVAVNPKNKEKHESYHPLQTDPTVYFNVGTVIKNPDKVNESNYSTPEAIRHHQDGEIWVFEKDEFVQNLNLPGGYQRGGCVVVVKYEDPNKKQNPKNYTLTYRIKP